MDKRYFCRTTNQERLFVGIGTIFDKYLVLIYETELDEIFERMKIGGVPKGLIVTSPPGITKLRNRI